MKAQDLRIGNYLKRLDDSVFEVNSEDIQIVDRWDSSEDLLPKPIPLTEEWLLKFGFHLDSYKNFELNNININRLNFKLTIFEDDDWYDIPIKTKYVHQLQNLYFALTGEELIIK